MYRHLANLLELSDSSFIIYKHFEWKSDELISRFKGEALFIDEWGKLSRIERLKIEREIFDADRVVYLKNPFEESERVEEVLLDSRKTFYRINLLHNYPMNRLRFLKFSLFSPRVRHFLYWLSSKQSRFQVVKASEYALEASQLFEILASKANQQRNCYILGMNRPKAWLWQQKA